MSDPSYSAKGTPLPSEGHRAYATPESRLANDSPEDDEIDLRKLWQIVWCGKWIIVVFTALFACGSTAYSLLATEWWRAEVVLSPVEDNPLPAISGQLGGLAALAGVSLGDRGQSADALAILRSRQFARDFIEDRGLLPVMFASKWDAERKAWRSNNPKKQPDLRDAVKKFHEDVLSVSQNNKTKLVTLGVEWTDPDVAAIWAGDLVRRINVRMRERAEQRAEANVAYLKNELAKTNVVPLQQAISSLLERETQTLMIARGNEEFAFRVLDAPIPPKFRTWPKRALTMVLGTLIGSLLGLCFVFLLHFWRQGVATSSADESNS